MKLDQWIIEYTCNLCLHVTSWTSYASYLILYIVSTPIYIFANWLYYLMPDMFMYYCTKIVPKVHLLFCEKIIKIQLCLLLTQLTQ